VRVGILGPLEVRDAAGNSVPLAGPRLRMLLVRLAAAGGRAVAADRLAEDLWPGDRPADAANALQALVSRLRQAAGRDLVEYLAGGYRLAVDPGQIDAVAFERLVGSARGALADGDQAYGAAMLEEALGLWRGPALADAADAAFAAGPVARLEELRVAAAEDLIESRLALGCGSEIVPDAEELATSHPLRERLRGQLMRALYAAGRQADALAVYEETRRMLAERLGVDPSPELAAVHLAILRGDPGLRGDQGPNYTARRGTEATVAPSAEPQAAEAVPLGEPALSGEPVPGAEPALAAASALTPGAHQQGAAPQRSWHERRPGPGQARTTNLPAQFTSFVGREDELERVGKQLGEARLVTLTGPGGAGKTRLAVEASARWVPRMPDGVWFIPLAPVRDALDVPQAVLAGLGIPEAMRVADASQTARALAVPPLDRLADFLASRRLILVLDNCEHLVDAVAGLAGRLLADASGVRILATSREPLGITGETLCPVPSLPLPPAGVDAVEAMSYAAVRLFEDRAAAVRPGFAAAGDIEPVIRICRALDGIPLAIELAAARLRSLTLRQVESRLDDRFRLLAIGPRAAAERHQTLRAIVDWSWDLLDETERAVLRRLSVFSGGATPEAAEQVCALGGAATGVIDVIASLVDKSLVIATGDADVRYHLLETVRAYAGERLAEAGEQDRARAAHASYFLHLAERAEPLLRTGEQITWLDRLTAEHGNCAAALHYAIDTRDASLGLRLVASLTWFWIMRDYDAEGSAWASAVQDIAGASAPPGLEDHYAICAFAALVSAMSSAPPTASAEPMAVHPQGLPLLHDALKRAASLAGKEAAHPMLVLVAPLTAMFNGDMDEARRGLRALTGHPDPWVRAAGPALCGHMTINEGDVEAAARDFEAGYAGFQAVGDRWGLMISLGGLAEVAMARGEPAQAVRVLEEARQLVAEGMPGNWGEMHLIPLGRARAAAGDIEGARADLERGARAAGRTGGPDDEITAYLELAELARRGGDLARARGMLERARSITEPKTQRMEMRLVTARTFSKLGCVAEQEGDLDAAARWHAKAIKILTQADWPFLPITPTLAEAVEGFAALAAARGQHARAAELLGLAHTLHGFRDAASFEVARTTAGVTAAIGEDACTAAYERGRQLTRDDALALTG
jgi:predicted ATPase/DNA-binding SARP family transcriptional activator